MKELTDFNKMILEANENGFDLEGAEDTSDYGGVEYINTDDLYDQMISSIAGGLIAQGQSEKKAKKEVDKAIKSLVKDKAISAYPKEQMDNVKMLWIVGVKPIVISHMILTGELML